MKSNKMILEARVARGLTQTAVSEAAGCTQAHIAYLENGQRKPTNSVVMRSICKVLDIDIKTLLQEVLDETFQS